MASHGNLKRRANGVYVVRLRVPTRFRTYFGRAEVHHSTGVRDARQAKIAAGELNALWHAQLLTLERMDPNKIVVGALELLGTGLMPLDEACELLGTNRRMLMEELINRKRQAHVQANDWCGWAIDDVRALDAHDEVGFEVDLSDTALEQHGRRKIVSQALAIRFAQDALAVATSEKPIEVCVFMEPPSRCLGFVAPLPGRQISAEQLLVRRIDVEAVRQAFAAHVKPGMLTAPMAHKETDGAGSNGHASPKHASMKVSELAQRYLDRQRPTWSRSTLQENTTRADILTELTNDAPLKNLDRDMLWRVMEELKGAPARRDLIRRRYPELGPGIRPTIARAKELGLPKVNATTLAKLARGFNEILNWGVVQTYLTSNPADKLSDEVFRHFGGKRSRDDDERDPLSPDDLNRIFSSHWFREGAGKRTPKGTFYAYRPHYYWLPLLALYSGGRLNELCQLYLKDIETDGVAHPHIYFNLEGDGKVDADAKDKSLKTANSQRRVPLHPTLIDLGILAYVEKLKAAGHTRLFPELSHDAMKGYGKAAGKWFNERFMGRELEIKRDGRKTFHSFRHNFSTALGDQGVPTQIKSQLLGHSRGSTETERRYDKGRDLAQLFEQIAKLQYALPRIQAFDVDAGLESLADAITLKTSRRHSR